MTIWLTDVSSTLSADSVSIGIQKTKAFLMPFSINGLLPNSEYFFFVDDTDMTWATAQSGKNMGDGLLSDENGKLQFNFYAELIISTSETSNDLKKSHLFQIKDVNGIVRATGIVSQKIKVKT